MKKTQLLIPVAVAVALLVGSAASTAQSQGKQLRGDGAIVAFHKQWRHPVKPFSAKGFGTPADIWIVRIDRWTEGNVEGKYFLVSYMLYEKAVSKQQINQPGLRFRFRKPEEQDGPRPCRGFPLRMDDFQRTKPGLTEKIPPVVELPCLIAVKPPEANKGKGGI